MGLGALGPDPPARWPRSLPKPGEGPSPEAQERGSFDIRFTGTTADGRTIETQVTGDRDPGYGSTAKMLGETAVAFLDLGPRPRSAAASGRRRPRSATVSSNASRPTPASRSTSSDRSLYGAGPAYRRPP